MRKGYKWCVSIIRCPQSARWHGFLCFTAGLTDILLPDNEASVPRQPLQKLLRLIKSQASVRKLPVVFFLTTNVSLQASFLLCRFGSGIARKGSHACFQIPFLYGLKMLIHVIKTKKAENVFLKTLTVARLVI